MTPIEKKLDLIFTRERLESENILVINYDPNFFGKPRLEIVYSDKVTYPKKKIYLGHDTIRNFFREFNSKNKYKNFKK